MTEALFHPDGPAFVPSARARGPWDPTALHGGPTAALVVRAVERHEPDDGPSLVSRLTLELLRPVPVAPLTVSVRTTRPGRRVQLLEASVRAGDAEVARARALRLRGTPLELPEGVTVPGPPPRPEELPPPAPAQGDYEAFHNAGVEMRYAAGEFRTQGPATVWIRLTQPVVAGEEPTPVMRAAAAADFGNGVSGVLVPFERYLFINPDLTVYLLREPVGEWACLDAVTYPSASGVGLAESALSDVVGRFGRAVQSLLLGTR